MNVDRDRHSGSRAASPGAVLSGGVQRWNSGRVATGEEWLAVEEPLEIRLAGFSLAVTMRTPGDDFDLVYGFLVTEGILASVAQIASIAYCANPDGDEAQNIVNVNVTDAVDVDPARWQRNFFASSSCGICGKASIEGVRLKAPPLPYPQAVSPEVLGWLEDRLRAAQPTFDRTGGLHAAGLFDLEGALIAAREDVGRHNAVDKAIGHALAHKADLSRAILMVSGRASFEIAQKAVMAGIPAVAAVSAPSSLAVELARESGMTLVGFLRGGRFNVYSGAVGRRHGTETANAAG